MTGQPTETKRLPKDLREALPAETRREAPHLRQGPARRPARRRLGVVRRRARAAQGGRPARLDPAPVPALVLHLVGEPRRDRGGGRAAARGRHDAARSSSGARPGSTRRTSSGRSSSSATAKIPLVMVDGPQGFKSSVPADRRGDLAGPRDRALPRPPDRDVGGEGHPDRRALPLPVRRGRARASGRRGSARPRRQAKDTHVLFNNCYANYGATNALELAQLLLDLEAGR